MSKNSFGSASELSVAGASYRIHRLDALGAGVERLPYTLKVLLENLLRNEDGDTVRSDDIEALSRWSGDAHPGGEIAFRPARVLMQDFTGVPAVCDLAAMRDTLTELGGDPAAVRPAIPVELVVDHSVIAEWSGSPEAFGHNAAVELERNRERYKLLRWAQQGFDGFSVVPPDTGICHQVNLEHLSRVVFAADGDAYPDTLVGTDSHTPMVNGLGVLGWGVGGIEAEAAMLGQPLAMVLPPVVGLYLHGELPEGSTATDLVLTIAQLLRRVGVVGKFVEVFGPGIASVPLETRATIGNMSPEYGSTATMFPVDSETLRYLRFTGRPEEQVALVEAYTKEQQMFYDGSGSEPLFSERVELDLSCVEPSIAGPSRPQDRVSLASAPSAFSAALGTDGRRKVATALLPAGRHQERAGDEAEVTLEDGAVVIAAITSCTNTSNPEVMVAAGLLAKKAVERGLRSKPWVKTSLAPGSTVVMDYLGAAGLTDALDTLGFNLVGYGCTTCIGNSGPLLAGVSEAVAEAGLSVSAVLSGNRNFEGRIHPDVRMNWLASPPLVVAYALAGTMGVDLTSEPLGTDTDGAPVTLSDIWPSTGEISAVIRAAVRSEMFRSAYDNLYGDVDRWGSLEAGQAPEYVWERGSTYVKRPPFFDGVGPRPDPVGDIVGARALAVLGDSVTTDHISPAGSIPPSSPAGRYLLEAGVPEDQFNSYGARRGNHEVMVRGTFANTRLRNLLAPGTEGSATVHLPSGEQCSIYEASLRYAAARTPLIVLAGKEYGSGSSRDWAAKGPRLLGVVAVIAESFERIHRSNLIGMGILPLQFEPGASLATLGLTGRETFDITGIDRIDGGSVPERLVVSADGATFRVQPRLDTPQEADYYRHGGILPYVVRQLLER
ncbi:MAG: aconitate hydratase AcnA [Actinomycetota bacterium]|nr:aconitate hydratase AcnA [Actinomycetota bacterium]